jgi:hypothetical protein
LGNTLPTPFPEVNQMVQELLLSIQSVLGERLVGMYLDGSLGTGDFDEGSDIDFVAATTEEVDEATFLALQAMHDRMAETDSRYALELEGSYVSLAALRRYDPANDNHPNIERGKGERLKLVAHSEAWNIHRFTLREKGIVLYGPDPRALVDPVTPQMLRRTLGPVQEWAESILQDPAKIDAIGYQSYVVITMCRALYTLEFNAVASKPVAVQWAKEAKAARWAPLIDRAWEIRRTPSIVFAAGDLDRTLELIRFMLDQCRAG